MGGAHSRNKGANYEREIANDMRAIFPKAKRGIQTRYGGEEVPDVDIPVFHMELKRGKKPSPRAALAQAIRDCPDDKMPVALVRDDHAEAFVVMRYPDWFGLMQLLFKEAHVDD